MLASGLFKELIFFAFSAAIGFDTLKNAQQGNHGQAITKLVFSLVFVAAFVLAPGNVIIEDRALNEKREVTNLPLAVVMLGGAISQLTDAITHNYETHFSIPDDNFLSFRRYGTLFGANLLRSVDKAEIHTPRLSSNMKQFMAQCIVPDIRIKARYTAEQLWNAPKPWDLIKDNTSPLRGILYDPGVGEPVFRTCQEAAVAINNDLDLEAKREAAQMGFSLSRLFNSGKESPSLEQKSKSYMKDAVENQLGLAHQFFFDASSSSFDILKQHMIRNYIQSMPETYAVMKGASSAAQAYGLARAQLTQENSVFISGMLSPDNLLRIYTIFQAIIYGSLPIIVLLIPFSIGWSVVGMYTGALVWVHSWPIFFAIINYIQNEALYTSLSAASKTVTGFEEGAPVFATGWTVMNSPAIASANYDVSQTAGMMIASVPVISFIIVKGAHQAVHVASNWFAKGEGAAQESAGRMTDGDVSGGNVNIGNRTAHNESMYHVNRKPSFTGAGFDSELMSGSRLGVTGNGERILNQAPGISQTATDFRCSDMIQESFRTQSQNALNTMQGHQDSYGDSIGQASLSAMRIAQSGGFGESSGQQYHTSDGVSIDTVASESQRLVSRFARENNMNEQQAARLLTGVTGYMSAGWGSKNSVVGKAIKGLSGVDAEGGVRTEGGISYGNDTMTEDKVSAAYDFAKENGLDKKFGELVKASKDINYSDNQRVSTDLSSDHSANLQRMTNAGSSYQTSVQNYKSVSDLAEQARTQGTSINSNLQNYLVKTISQMDDGHGNELGITKADQLLRDPDKARPYLEHILEHRQEELKGLYDQHALTRFEVKIIMIRVSNELVMRKSLWIRVLRLPKMI